MTFEAIYDRHFDFVWSTLRRLGVPPADLPDVSQEVFVAVHRRLSEFEPRAKLTTWLFSICLHAARDRRRRAHVRHEIQDGQALDALVARGEGADLLLERRDDHALFQLVLDGLSDEHRTVFVMYELSELTGEEIAGMLEIPLGTVYSRLRHAREGFRRGVARATAGRARNLLRREGAG